MMEGSGRCRDMTGGMRRRSLGNGGKYLSLKQRGDSVRIRIVSRPFKFVETFAASEANGRPARDVARFAWTVIHKEFVDGKAAKSVKAFKAGMMVYKLIYDLVVNEDWGDPTLYDLQITRTEEKGRYYTVSPLPKPTGPISETEAALVEAAALDLEAMFLNAPTAGHDEDDDRDPFADS